MNFMKFNFSADNFFPEGWLKTWRPYFLLFVVIFLVYGRTLFFDLTFLDDNALILDKQEILGHLGGLKTIFSSDAFLLETGSYYRPLLNVSFWLDSLFGPLNYAVYHFFSLWWHFLAVALAFAWLSRLSQRRQPALAIALIMAVHPALAAAVAWLPGRNDILAAVFVLLSFWYFFNFLEQERLRSFIAASIFFFLALLSKETVVGLPVLFIIYFFLFKKEKSLNPRSLYLSLAGSATVGAVWFLLRQSMIGSGHLAVGGALRSIIDNLPAAAAMAAKLFFPFKLSGLPVAADAAYVLALAAALVIAAALIFSKHKDWRYLIFGSAWFAVFFLPPLVINAAAPFFLENRLYLPFIGLAIIFFGFREIRSFSWKNLLHRRFFFGLLLCLVLICFVHIGIFADRLNFWQSTAAASPHSPLAQRNLGAMYYLDGRPEEAEIRFRQALALNPSEPMAHNNLAVIYLDRGDLWRAERELKQELAINPAYDLALFNLGRVYYERQQYQEAALLWQEVLRLNPGYREAALKLQEAQKNLN